MTQTINGARKMVVKRAIKEHAADLDGRIRPGTPAYDDLMQNVEHQVQSVLEEAGEINY